MIFSSINVGEVPKKYYGSDLSIVFPVDIDVEGDILIWARHFRGHQDRYQLFWACFHTSFVNETVLWFEKDQLDGAIDNDEFDD